MYKAKDLGLGIEEEKGFACYRELDSTDLNLKEGLVELVPEAYLDSPDISTEEIQEQVEQLLREFSAFEIKYEKQLSKIER